MNYTQIPININEELQKNAGILLTEFDPKAVIDDSYIESMREKILLATDGGVQFNDEVDYSDSAEGIDNMPTGTMEGMEVDSRNVHIAGTGKTLSKNNIPYLMGAVDHEEEEAGLDVYTPRDDLKVADFKELWYVCDYGVEGGFIAIHMKNTLNTSGLSIKSNNKGKGEMSFDFKAHYSSADTSEVPYKLYIREKAKGAA